MQSKTTIRSIGASCVAALLIGVFSSAGADEPPPYTIVGGKVDPHTYTGWQTFRHAGCGMCHGGAATGGAGPSLVERLKHITRDQFVNSVTNGKNQMPPWKGNQQVMGNLDNLYSYLKARSDGAVGEGKLEQQ